MKARTHAVAGVIGFLTIAAFWTSTVTTELLGSEAAIASVKRAILWGTIVLIPAMAIAGGTGMSLSKTRTGRIVATKKKRMPFIALNGLMILVPAAFFLASKASVGEFDFYFYAVQILELAAGATNLSLMGLNIRDGIRLSGRRHRRPKDA